jgi:hypothetical protein
MSTKHTVTLPDGTTATRTSQNREYVAAIAVGPETREYAAARLATRMQYRLAEIASYQRTIDAIDGGLEVTTQPAPSYLRRAGVDYYLGEERVNHFANANDDEVTAAIVRSKLVGYVESLTAEHAEMGAEREALLAGPALVEGQAWGVASWAGRLDLATKAAAKEQGFGREVRIITDVTTIKK